MKLFLALVCGLLFLEGSAQKIAYSEPEREDSRRTDFEIIGKIGNNYQVFKNNRSENAICIYDNSMKLIERVNLDFMPDHWINADFIAYPDFSYLIYQYQKKSIVYCSLAKIDDKGKTMGEPVVLDTTHIGWAANNKIYNAIYSEDKQRIMIFKINSKNPKNFVFTTLLFNSDMKLIVEKQRLLLPMEERNDFFSDFLLDNDGNLVFGKLMKNGGSDYISRVLLVAKPAEVDSFVTRDLGNNDKVLDEVKIKIDNTNKRCLFTAFYYKQKRGNIEGLYTVGWDKDSKSLYNESFIVFNDELRNQAKSSDASVKMAFNDYFIKNLLTRKDGSFVIIGESEYTTSRAGAFNRWDYLSWNNPWSYNSYDSYYYSPGYNRWYSPWNRWTSSQAVRYHAENILVLYFDKDAKLIWANVIPKSQYDDESDNLISHQVMITGGQLHFMFNQYERKNLMLNDQSVGPDGKITRYPTLKSLDRGYEFMPRYGKQVSAKELLVPCMYRNYLCFAKLEF